MIVLNIDNKKTVAHLIVATAKYVIVEIKGLRKSFTTAEFYNACR
jgi:hypothetical protein